MQRVLLVFLTREPCFVLSAEKTAWHFPISDSTEYERGVFFSKVKRRVPDVTKKKHVSHLLAIIIHYIEVSNVSSSPNNQIYRESTS
jgi:hypothetical protein